MATPIQWFLVEAPGKGRYPVAVVVRDDGSAVACFSEPLFRYASLEALLLAWNLTRHALRVPLAPTPDAGRSPFGTLTRR